MTRRDSNTHAALAADRLINIAAGLESPENAGPERRAHRRVPYDAAVTLLLCAPTGERGRPMVLKARDISLGGISVVGRQMIYPGSQGVAQLVRSDGRIALVGVVVTASRYIGNMRHLTGLSFIPLPQGFSEKEFLDKDGRLLLIDKRLRSNIDPAAYTRPLRRMK
jgi:hypothetical protein